MRRKLPGSTCGARNAACVVLALAVPFIVLFGGMAAAAEKSAPFREAERTLVLGMDYFGSASASGGGLLVAAATDEGTLADQATQAAQESGGQGGTRAAKQDAPSAAPPKARAATGKPPPPKTDTPLFNSKTVEFRALLQENIPRWQRVLKEEKRSPTFAGDLSKYMRTSLYKEWQALVAKLAGASDLEKAKAVTAFFNRWPYRTDQSVYKVADYWATPKEFLKNSGDCEDYAITKFYALVELGVDPGNMRIVVLMDTIQNIGHAVLLLYADGTAYVLDNMNSMLLPHTDVKVRHYDPKNSINLDYRWAHVKSSNPKK